MSPELIDKENQLEQRRQELTLVEKLKLKRSSSVLILDTSGSMAADIEPGKTKISALRDIVQSANVANKIFWFNSGYGECDKDTIPNPAGGTFLAQILTHIKSLGHKSAVVITDGDINDKAATLLAKEGMNIKVMYVGSGQRPSFLDQLANAGQTTTEDLKQTKQLVNKIQLLLGPSSVERKGAIEL